MLCPGCRSLMRGNALRCWKCGTDLTQPYEGPATAGAGADALSTAALPTATAGATPPDAPERIGPPPRTWLERTFDPRITPAELARAASAYKRVPWIEAYHKPAALGLLPLALLLEIAGQYARSLVMPHGLNVGGAGNPAGTSYYHLTEVLGWAPISVLALAYFVYRGNAGAIVAAGILWLLTLGSIALVPALLLPPAVIFTLFVVGAIYVEVVLLYKAWRVAMAHHEYVWRGRI